jgi:hypothetical protein
MTARSLRTACAVKLVTLLMLFGCFGSTSPMHWHGQADTQGHILPGETAMTADGNDRKPQIRSSSQQENLKMIMI